MWRQGAIAHGRLRRCGPKGLAPGVWPCLLLRRVSCRCPAAQEPDRPPGFIPLHAHAGRQFPDDLQPVRILDIAVRNPARPRPAVIGHRDLHVLAAAYVHRDGEVSPGRPRPAVPHGVAGTSERSRINVSAPGHPSSTRATSRRACPTALGTPR